MLENIMNKTNDIDLKLDSELNILINALISMKDKSDLRKLLLDLCTPSEIEALSGRLLSARLIHEKIPYRQIHSKIGVSLVTISRVARSLKYGSGGYDLFLDLDK